jgi:primosomal protein N'
MQVMKSTCKKCGDVSVPVKHMSCGGIMSRNNRGEEFSCESCGFPRSGVIFCDKCRSTDVNWVPVDAERT